MLFPAYTDTLTITVQQIDDSESETNEYVIMNLTGTNNSRVSIAPAPDSTATVTVFDDDMPLVSLLQTATTFSENNGRDTLIATLNKVHYDDVTVYLGVSGTAAFNTDYTMVDSIVIKAGNLSGTAVITATQDQLVESNETVTVDISSVTNGVEDGTQSVSTEIVDDDVALLTVTATAGASEGGDNGVFTISTDKQFDTPVTVFFTLGGMATGGVDYTSPGSAVVFPACSDWVTVAVAVVDDDIVETDETVVLTVTGTDNVKVSASATGTATVNIRDNDTAVLRLGASRDGTEGGPDGYFTLESDHPASFPVAASAVFAGLAREGYDYAALGGTLVLPAGSLSVQVPVAVVNDTLVEGPEDVQLVLTGTPFNRVQIDDSRRWSRITVYDNDYAVVSAVKVRDASEDGVTGLFSLVTDRAPEHDVAITVGFGGTALEGGDYASPGGTVVLPGGSLRADIAVAPVDDDIVEGNEDILLMPLVSGNGNVVLPHDTAFMALLDNDKAVVRLASSGISGEGTDGTGQFTVTSTKRFAEPVILDMEYSGNAAAGVDYETLPAAVELPAMSYTVSVPVIAHEDTLVEGSEGVYGRLTGVGHPDAGIDTLHDGAMVIIRDNDFANITVTALSDAPEGGPAGLFLVRSDHPAAYGVTLTHVQEGTATEGIDYTPLSGPLYLPSGAMSLTVPVIALRDDIDEDNETVTLRIVSTSNENVLTGSGTSGGTMVITDANPLPVLTVESSQGTEGSGLVRFTVRLSEPGGRDVVVSYSTVGIGDATPGADYTGASGQLVFAPGQTTDTVDVVVNDDALSEYDESFLLVLNTPVNAVISGPGGTGTIIDDDPDPSVHLSFSPAAVLENGGESYLRATLGAVSGKRVSVVPVFTGTATDGTDYTVTGDTLRIAAGATGDSLKVTALPDNLYEGGEQAVAKAGVVLNAVYDNVAAVLDITDQDQRITFEELPPLVYGSAATGLTGVSTSGLGVDYTSSNSGVAVIEGNILTITGAGTAVITASRPGDGVYDPAPAVTRVLTVGKAPLEARADDKTRVYGEDNPVLTVTCTGFVNGDGTGDIDELPAAVTAATAGSDAGEYAITVIGGTDNNYDITGISGTLAVGRAPQVITFELADTVHRGDAPLALTATSSSGLPVYYGSSDAGVISISGSEAVIGNTGSATVTARQDGDGNYLPADDVPQTVTVLWGLGIEQPVLSGPLCYPNPFERVITLDASCERALEVRLYDLNGREVLRREGPVRSIDCSTLRGGVYLLEADFGNGVKARVQVVKKR